MEHKINQSLQVYNQDGGDYKAVNVVVVEFTGKKGLKAIKRLQDIIFGTFTAQAGNAKEQTEEQKKKEKAVTVNDVLDILEMTGSSEKLFDEVLETLKDFATIGDSSLTEALQNEMSIEDLDDLCKEVLKHFLLPKITHRMNSMSK